MYSSLYAVSYFSSSLYVINVSMAVRIHAVVFLVMTVPCLVGWYQRFGSTLKVEAKHSTETFVSTYETTQCHHVSKTMTLALYVQSLLVAAR
jgi:hypothetical protein